MIKAIYKKNLLSHLDGNERVSLKYLIIGEKQTDVLFLNCN